MNFVCRITLAITLLAAAVHAQDDIDATRRNAIVRSVESAAPAVVSVNVRVEARMPRRTLFPEFFEPFQRPGQRIARVEAVGSAFIIRTDGVALTNYHVVESGTIDSVTLPDGRVLPAALLGADPRLDVAVLRVDGDRLPVLPLGDSADLLIGEWAIAIGNPFGGMIGDPQPSISVGVVSALNRRVSRDVGEGERSYQNMIQTDAAINPGNSGGPLVNARGQAIGINTMIFSQSGGNVGLGFAIPINRARRSAEEIIEFGRRRDPWAGFSVESVSAIRGEYLRQWGVTRTAGCVVLDIVRGCPAFEAGLRPGDVIVQVNGAAVEFAVDVDYAIWQLFVGDECTLVIDRQGTAETIRFPIRELAR